VWNPNREIRNSESATAWRIAHRWAYCFPIAALPAN
jgi:hypothetical protein